MASEMLPEKEEELLGLRMEGKTNEEIVTLAQAHEWTSADAVKMQASRTIRKIEKTVLFPAGIHRIAKWTERFKLNNTVLTDAIKRGKLEHIQLFDAPGTRSYHNYATEDMIKDYIYFHLTYVDQDLLEKGYVILSTIPEYEILKNPEYRHLLYVDQKGKRIYIHQDILDEWRTNGRRVSFVDSTNTSKKVNIDDILC